MLCHMTTESYRLLIYSFAFKNFNLEIAGSVSVARSEFSKHSELPRKHTKNMQKDATAWHKHKT